MVTESIVLTGTATASGMVGRAEPVTTISWTWVGLAGSSAHAALVPIAVSADVSNSDMASDRRV